MDLHLHTPASNDYQQPGISYLDILRQAEIRGLDLIAFTDHNTVAGFAAMKDEIKQLLWLEELDRLRSDEKRRLDEYRRLLNKILVLPGFEFTATFGFHILGIFPSETPINYLEHLLLTLNIPPEKLSEGSSTVGSTSDVLTAYRVINDAGGLVIAAHANSNNGVVMRGLDIGGQTRIAYTQDPNLHVLEVTDLEKRGRYTTRRFFSGSKPEYPRAMRCIQGSDAHRLTRENPSSSKNLGIGDRITEIFLDDPTFDSLAKVLKGNDLSLTRPYRGPANPIDFVQLAREEGESIVQVFHPTLAQRGGYKDRVLRDICAMANTNGGTIYVGVSDDPEEAPVGVRDPKTTINQLYTAVSSRITPEPDIEVDTLPSKNIQVVRITVQPGQAIPYAIDNYQFYVRDDDETNLAVRDEVVRLVRRSLQQEDAIELIPPPVVHHPPVPKPAKSNDSNSRSSSMKIEPPRTGVEIVDSEKRKGVMYHTVRDLRNGNLIQNVTKSSARKLWHYAISQAEEGQPNLKQLNWQSNMAVIGRREKGDNIWYDLALRDNDTIHFYYGVTDSGLNDDWLALVGES
ncbi:MAG: putative DNA binding domain-containing protein [Anaerolineae bacterium]|nr:putative DNA binding domain-containing protein [Anaerolineae bacterium]